MSRLDHYVAPTEPRAVVLLLHGGQQHNVEPVKNRHASWWRMAALARSLRRHATEHDFALSLLQYGQRGWNDPIDPSPVKDTRAAISELTDRWQGVPVVLVGHSMGGRTACRAADDPSVIGVVGLAPWLPEGEPNASISGKHLRILHGTQDSWTSPALSREYVERSLGTAASATWTSLPGGGHFMFRQSEAWKRFVKDSVTDIVGVGSSQGRAAQEDRA
ncbi:dienelactone hydrolase [Aeromicrobium panaciterrae]|uniref:Dienelactone hydrolase n=1 Tax=Aeromicrobium panaciterrae TaxID=363861 RepID=A0ABU1UNX9_9ACTN|nr:alpha/beta fold hydrolase [Aeromicrobium panaciterrae]MDR7086888.1 dienelactone hydrolase [Aeromicrobium panaciterrae]